MTVHLEWPPEVVDRLTKQASQRGMSLEDLKQEVLVPLFWQVVGRAASSAILLTQVEWRIEKDYSSRLGGIDRKKSSASPMYTVPVARSVA